MNQRDLNAQEWNNPANWSRKQWLGVHFSKRDTRVWVPKPLPASGWTLNFAQPRGAAIVLAIIIAAACVASLAPMLARS